jgi:CRISPR type IV-associated protein Csf2
LRVRIVAEAVPRRPADGDSGVTATIRWSGTVTAVSSIAHGGQQLDTTTGQQLDTTTLLRREKMLLADGRIDYVPVISGNTLRGWLRRVGEDLLREQLRYDGQLSLTAAHALRGGGALTKTNGAALAGQRLATLRSLVPQVGVFGCAAGGSVINGFLQVGKVVPLVSEFAHAVPVNLRSRCVHSHFDLLQVEAFARQDDTDTHVFAGRTPGPTTTPR